MGYTERLDQAFCFAAELHRNQLRKGTDVPYLTHLMGVAELVGSAGGTEDEVIAALLHDAVEDQGGHATLEEIRRRFGDRVAEIVEGCSDAFEHPKPPWRPRKEAFLDRLADATESVHLVVSADKLHNARSLVADLRANGAEVWSRFRGGKAGTLWHYEAAIDTLRDGAAPTQLLDELIRTVAEIRRLTRMNADGGNRG